MTGQEQTTERIRCFARTHAKLRDHRRLISWRCTDGECPDAVHAKMTDQLCIHECDLHDPALRTWSEFELQVRKQ